MSARTRKFVGTILLLVVLVIYSLLVMLAAAAVLPDGGKIVELIFYAVAGIAWVLPAGYLVKWMYATPPENS
ncbi:MAG TPA: DUF2842 domain-containing protein [Hyphomicrobiaceae bacterium]|jgi:hypothetical protein|nr:DUF2842 domain-containing protein [Hyphomicrobiaceae bacterium]